MAQIEQQVSSIAMMPDDLNEAIRLLEFVLQNPDKYQPVRQAAINDGLIDPSLVPEQFDQVFLVSLLAVFYELQDRLGRQGFSKGGLARAVQQVKAAGRGGDTMLAHINPREAAMLEAMGGSGTINPNTGIVEYKSKFGKILGAVAPIVLSLVAPGLGTAIGTALGATGTAASALGGAVIGGASAGLTGGNVLKGAALGGLGGGLGSAVGGAANNALGLGLGETGQAMLGSGLVGGALGALTGENPLKGAAMGALGGAAGSLGGQAGLGNAFAQAAKGFGNSLAVGNDLKTSAISGGLAGLSSAILSPGQAAADQYKAGQDKAMYGKGAVETSSLSPLGQSQYNDVIPNDASGNTIGGSESNWRNPDTGQIVPVTDTQPANAETSTLGSLVKYAPLALAGVSALSGGDDPEQAVASLSPDQQAYFNRPNMAWDWQRLQQEARQSMMPLQTYITQNWNKISSGAYNQPVTRMAKGGIASLVRGGGSGRADTVPAKLSHGEYVFDAEAVAMIGDGSSEEGARRLDRMRENIRKHKGKKLAKGKISPNAKAPEKYLEDA